MKMIWMALLLAGALMAQPPAAQGPREQAAPGPQLMAGGPMMEMDEDFGPGPEFEPGQAGPMQGGPGGPMHGMPGMGPGMGMGMMAPGTDAVKEALGLSDAQITQLQELRKAQATALRKTHLQILEKQEALRELLDTDNPDPLKVGQLVVETRKLRKNTANSPSELRAKAQAVLSAEQKTKLQALVKAEGMSPALRQAAALGLTERPARMRQAMRQGMGPQQNMRPRQQRHGGQPQGAPQGGPQGGPGAPPQAGQ